MPPTFERRVNQNNKDTPVTPKLVQQIHQTTIIEENETMRGSIDRPPVGQFNAKKAKSKAQIKVHN